ncbi:MAG: PAS domain S-box protein, partial [Verrucomicrobia bacterium]
RAVIEQELVVIAQFKVDQLEHYRRMRLADGQVFFHNPAFAALARRVLETPADADACRDLQTWLGKYQSSYQYNRVFLLDSQGATRMAVPRAAEPVAALISQQAPAILRADRVVWQDFYRNEGYRDVYLAVMVPICDESQPARPPLGLLVLRIDPDVYLNPLIQRWPKSSPTAETVLLRRDGNEALCLNNLRLRPDAALNLRIPLQRLENPSVQAVLGHTGFFRGKDYRGVPVLSAVLPVPDSPWWLVTKVNTAEAEAPMHRQFWQVVGVVGILLFSVTGGVGLVWWQQLDRYHLERMVVAEALQTSEGRFRQLFETNATPIAFWNTAGLFTDANDAWCKVIAMDPVQVRAGKVSWKTITPPEMQARDLAAIREIQAVGQCQPYEKDFIRPDGSRVTVLLMGGAMLVGSPTEGVAFAVDLTERKQAEAALRAALAEKVVLLKEIHHRVKNNLQIISSLMHLQSSRIASAEAKAVLLEMQDRVRSMALIHEHLYRSDNLAAVDLAPYLRSLCTQLVRSAAATSGSIHLQMDLAPVQLEIDKAIPCGLLVNELVTNAIKYAFPLGRHGVLRVDLQLLDGTPGWCLRVADDGVGLPTDFDLQKLISLGLKVVADLAHQLGGRLSIGSGPGAVFEVEFHGDGGSATTG